jgi:23S rRNA (uracil1939-C5)-methyltransferase
VADTLDLDIDSIDISGDGLARHGHDTMAVPFTIPGERVRARVTNSHAGVATATLVEVLRASPHRVAARCAHFGPCGGCSWQHIAYPEQLRLKTAIVDRLVRQAVPRAPRALATLPGVSPDDPWGFRQKVHFVFGGRDDGRLQMGHYARGSRRLVAVQECPVHDARGNAFAFELRDRYARAGITAGPGPAGRRSGALKGLALRVARATGELMATLVVRDDRDKRLRSATRRALDAGPETTSFHLNLHPRDDAFVFGPETRRLTGSERLRDVVAETSFLISPDAFFQTNVHAAEMLVRLVREAVPPGARVLDLYAGAGLFALPLARAGHHVVAVEENRVSVADGEASLRLNRIPAGRCRFIRRPVETALHALEAADAVVLDPPREGCAPSVLEGLFTRLRPQVVVYVSCNPEALARELPTAARHGYMVESLQPVDMFPHTAQIETVAVIRATRNAKG